MYFSGTKDVLKKRLKNFYKRQRLGSSLKAEDKMRYRYLIVIDYEATCSRTNENFIHEIIEFPAVLIDTESMAVVGLATYDNVLIKHHNVFMNKQLSLTLKK